ncbi:MAG: aminotransferase class IV [Thermodesulfobacteriota bacterium]
MISYLNGNYLPHKEIRISPDDRGFLFSDALYEVMHSYGGRLFQVQAHLNRLSYGAKALRYTIVDFNYLADVARRLIRDNGLTKGNALVYIQVTRGEAPRSHLFPSPDTPLTVYAKATPFSPRSQEREEGIRAILVPDQRWARCDIKTVSLLANTAANQEAFEKNAAEALFVRDGAVLEGTHTNLFAVLNGVLTTPPRTNYLLTGITRQVVLNLCRKHAVSYQERTILASELEQAEELMITGTTSEITPIVCLNGNTVGSGRPGNLTTYLQQAFLEFVDSSPSHE